MIHVRTRRSPMKSDVLTMQAAAVLALKDLKVFLLLIDFVVCNRVFLQLLSNVRQGREDDVLRSVDRPGKQLQRRCTISEVLHFGRRLD